MSLLKWEIGCPGAVERRTRVNGVETFSRTLGYGRDVLLIHGAGVSSEYWRAAQLALACLGPFRVHAVDLPGYGRSQTPFWAPTLPNLTEHLHAWIRERIPGEFDVVGQSLGCELAVRTAAEMPGRVGKLVLAAPNGLPDPRSVVQQVLWAGIDASREKASVFRAVLPDYFRVGAVGILKLLAEQRRDRTEHLLSAVSQPVLLLRGDRDALVSARRLQAVSRLMRHAQTVTVPGAHGAHISHPRDFARPIAGFLSD